VVSQRLVRCDRIRVELKYKYWRIVSYYLYAHKWCAHAVEQAHGGSGAWYAMELTELLPHVARGLNINWDQAIRYAGLNAEF
jgi:hypothetical protein